MRQIFINLAVKDLNAAKAFFDKLGFRFNPQFTNDAAACMVIDNNIFVMLVAENFFQTFTKKTLCDATKSTEVLVCLSCDSRTQVDDLVTAAVAAGEPLHAKRRIMALCTAMRLKIWMVISGSWRI